MLIRQKILLNFINNNDCGATRLQIVKLAFLLSVESKSKKIGAFYQFVPYLYGPFSFTLYHEFNQLVALGYIKVGEGKRLVFNETIPNKDYILPKELDLEIQRFGGFYNKFNPKELLEYVYKHYPWYTLKSSLNGKKTAREVQASNAVYTVGYENMQVDGFLNFLLRNGIQQIIDVRSNPLSRKYGFHKSTLSRLCNKVGIRYYHYPQLGIPSEYRTELNDFADYQRLFDYYEKNILSNNDSAITEIAELMKQRPSVLLCQESDPQFCHRTKLAEFVARKTGMKIFDLGDTKWKQTAGEQRSLLQ